MGTIIGIVLASENESIAVGGWGWDRLFIVAILRKWVHKGVTSNVDIAQLGSRV